MTFLHTKLHIRTISPLLCMTTLCGTLLTACQDDQAKQPSMTNSQPIQTTNEVTNTPQHIHEADTKSTAKKQHSHTFETAKPSAPITMQSDYDGHSNAYETESFQLTFSSPIDAKIDITIGNNSDIQLESETSFTGDISPDTPITFPISITPQKDGKIYLDVYAKIHSGNSPMAKAFSQVILVGDWKSTMVKHKNTSTDELGDPIILMPAKETIHSTP